MVELQSHLDAALQTSLVNTMSRGHQAYLESIDEATERLLTRQVELVRLSSNKEKDTGTIAAETAEIAACTTSMVRAVEDLLLISRNLKEAWVLGHVQKQQTDSVDEEELARRTAAAEQMVKLLRNERP